MDVKIVTLGSTGVGKTTLLDRWVTSQFHTGARPTLGAAYQSVSCDCEGVPVLVQFWDTAGQDTYKRTTSVYIRNAHGCLLVFDRTRRETFEDLPGWMELLNPPGCPNPAEAVLLANKSDLDNSIGASEIAGMAQRLGDIPYFETSAVSGLGVEPGFMEIVRRATGKLGDGQGCVDHCELVANDGPRKAGCDC
jgi:small GTP-binding protein